MVPTIKRDLTACKVCLKEPLTAPPFQELAACNGLINQQSEFNDAP